MLPDGTLELTLRATDGKGMAGGALLKLAPEEGQSRIVAKRAHSGVGSGRAAPSPPGIPAEQP